jgi:acetylornithine/succinyldiaminopimelate/putrescine aminotransferase
VAKRSKTLAAIRALESFSVTCEITRTGGLTYGKACGSAKSELQKLAARSPGFLKEVRGLGLMIGLEFPADAPLRRGGSLVNKAFQVSFLR